MSIDSRSDSYEALLWDVVCNVHRYVPTKDATVLDLGAHFGMFALYCAARGADVVALEPSPISFNELVHSSEVAKSIGLGAIEPHQCAVWDTVGKQTMWQCAATTGSNSMVRRTEEISFEVDTVTMAHALSLRPEWNCVKIDIEGAEYRVLKSMSDLEFERIRYLTIEVHNDILSEHECREVAHILNRHFQKVERLPVLVGGTVDTGQAAAYFCHQ
jgi:FkbM family methyltransferase